MLLASRQLDPLLSEWQYGLGRVMAWTSDATNLWASRWLQWPDFSRFWAQVVKRTDRPPEDPNRQITARIEGDHARITLDAQSGGELPDRHYLNFVRTDMVLVDPKGGKLTVPLPQVAPGRYETSLPVQSDGVYTLTATQREAGGKQVSISAGFVIPYSPEYRLTGTDQSLLEALVRRTGGRLIEDPREAFAHTLPSVGTPQPLWPPIIALLAILLVADVGVRRVRVSALDLRVGYRALRSRLGYLDELPGDDSSAAVSAIARRPEVVVAAAGLAGAPSMQSGVPDAWRRAPAPVMHSSRLLAAKQRAARR